MPGIVDAPRGFIPIKSFTGEICRINSYKLAAANAVLGKYDLVTLTNAGVIDRSAASDVQIVGCAATASAASQGTDNFPVFDAFGTIFEAQGDDATIAAQTDLNLNYNIVVADAVNGISQMEIDASTGNTTNTLPIKVLRLVRKTGNSFGANCAVECIINNHVLSGNLAGI